MAKVEVDEADYNLAVAQDKLWNDIWNDPVTGPLVKKAVKQKRPELNIPELDMLDTVEAKTKEIKDSSAGEIKAMREDMQKFMSTIEEERTTNKLRGDVDATAKKYGFTEDGKQKLIARAKDKGHLDWEAHAAAILKDAPAAQPAKQSTYFGERMNPNGAYDYNNGIKVDESIALLNKNPEKWSEDVAMDMFNNPENYPEMAN